MPRSRSAVAFSVRTASGSNSRSSLVLAVVTARNVFEYTTLSVACHTSANSRTYAGGWAARGPLVVGAGFDDGVETDRFAGAIDDVRVWNRALTPAEVRKS